MPLAIVGLVCPEARVKFKNIDFRTEADFASYCSRGPNILLVSVLRKDHAEYLRSAEMLGMYSNRRNRLQSENQCFKT